MGRLFLYVVDRDFGFAPNPFHGVCTLATCKARIRRSALVGDWVFGVGGSRLQATGRCIFAMRVDRKITFDEYWGAAEFKVKRPVRNGSQIMMLGDNIYHRSDSKSPWIQEDSHHSNLDGTQNPDNIANDTLVNAVLISRHYYYFGREAPTVPQDLLDTIGYRNARNHRVFDSTGAGALLVIWLSTSFRTALNRLQGDPFDFEQSSSRYSLRRNRVLGGVPPQQPRRAASAQVRRRLP
jgi:hypothetical protein